MFPMSHWTRISRAACPARPTGAHRVGMSQATACRRPQHSPPAVCLGPRRSRGDQAKDKQSRTPMGPKRHELQGLPSGPDRGPQFLLPARRPRPHAARAPWCRAECLPCQLHMISSRTLNVHQAGHPMGHRLSAHGFMENQMHGVKLLAAPSPHHWQQDLHRLPGGPSHEPQPPPRAGCP